MTIAESFGLLRAGALIPIDEPAVEGEPTDTISARSYAHAALGDRTVVRLVPDTIAAAEDLALDFLGLSLKAATLPLARGRRQALGFPGWALVNDPANGSYALAIVKDIERLSRLARVKPGIARDGFEQIGQHLARSVPHFQPTFYERAGRAFIESGNTAQAAAMFGRARQAERVYGLPVDEERRRHVFLEFALAGALTARALEDYADQLSQTHTPAEAYAAFRELCLQRTLGGVPPWTEMATRLQHMARSAQLEPAREAEAMLLALLEAPATRQAGTGFWKAYRQPLVALAKRQPRVRGQLLNLFPQPPAQADGFDDWWLDLLDACGALDSLTAPPGSVPIEAAPTGGSAAWLERSVAWLHGGWLSRTSRQLVALLPRLAPRLRDLGVQVDLIGGRQAWQADLELIDAALELEIPLAPPPASASLLLHEPRSGRNLEHVVKHPDWRPALRSALEALIQNPRGRIEPFLAVSGVQILFAEWLDSCADALERGGLPKVAFTLNQLERVTGSALALNPGARARMLSADLGNALARTVRGGLMDELGWPALEAAWPKLRPGKDDRIQIGYAWPNLIVTDASRAVVVGPSGVVLEHDLRPPPQVTLRSPNKLVYAGGQLLVIWQRSNTGIGYWSGRPGVVFDLEQVAYAVFQGDLAASWELADGSRTFGGRALHPGDSGVAHPAHMLTDGTTFWQLVFDPAADSGSPRPRLREYDPTTGRAGATSLPAFLREFDTDARPLRLDRCWLLPVVPGVEATPLGSAGGLLGWRVRSTGADRNQTFEVEGIDGRAFSARLAVHAFAGSSALRRRLVPTGLVSVPGDESNPRPMSLANELVSLWSVDGGYEVFQSQVGASAPPMARGTPLVLSPLYWHNLRLRDAAGSRALRAMNDAVAPQLLESATGEIGDESSDRDELPGTQRLIRKLLPEVSDVRLLRGIGGVVHEAGRLARQRAKLIQPSVQPTHGAPSITDLDLQHALQGLVSRGSGWHAPSSHSMTMEQLHVVAGVIRGGPMPPRIPAATLPWTELVGRMAAVAFRAAAEPTPATQRATLLALLDLWADTPFATIPPDKPAGGGLRQALGRLIGQQSGGQHMRVALVRDTDKSIDPTKAAARLIRNGGHIWLIGDLVWMGIGRYRRWLLEFSTDGSFSLPNGLTLDHDRPVFPTWDEPKRLRAVGALIRERGPLPWQPQRVEALATLTGLSRPEAALLLAGLPGIDSTEHNFLDKQLRELLGLKVTEAAVAQRTFKVLPRETRLELLAAAMPDDPSQLWDSEELVERLAAAWLTRFARRAKVPDQLITQVRSTLTTPVEAPSLLSAFADPGGDPRLNRDGRWVIVSVPRPGLMRTDDSGEAVFDGGMLASVAQLLPWLFGALPVGDPLRANVPKVLERVRRRLDNPELLIDFGWLPAEIQGRGLLDLLPGTPYQPAREAVVPASRDAGWFVVVGWSTSIQYHAGVFLRPAALTGSEDPSLLQLVGAGAAYHATRFLRGSGATAMAERIEHTPVPAGGYEANPLLSAPTIVDDMVAELSLDRDAAAVYLQMLALAEPTTRNLSTWNAWPTKRVAANVGTLVERALLVRATRMRAGREAFLPCAWENLMAPNLPIERWKLPLYEDGPLYGRVLPLRPLHELFSAAWERVRAGDGPAFEPLPQSRGGR